MLVYVVSQDAFLLAFHQQERRELGSVMLVRDHVPHGMRRAPQERT